MAEFTVSFAGYWKQSGGCVYITNVVWNVQFTKIIKN
jgi:hypothetical protein